MTHDEAALLKQWSCFEAFGIDFCRAVAQLCGDPALKSRWLVMADMEQRMLAEISQCFDGASAIDGPATDFGGSVELARDFLDRGAVAGSAWLAQQIKDILLKLREDVATLSPGRPVIFDRLILHEEAWLDFLQLEASNDPQSSLTAPLNFLSQN